MRYPDGGWEGLNRQGTKRGMDRGDNFCLNRVSEIDASGEPDETRKEVNRQEL